MTREKEIIEILCREMRAYGNAWRMDWSDFDGRQLLSQLGSLAIWAENSLKLEEGDDFNYVDGTEFLEYMDRY